MPADHTSATPGPPSQGTIATAAIRAVIFLVVLGLLIYGIFEVICLIPLRKLKGEPIR